MDDIPGSSRSRTAAVHADHQYIHQYVHHVDTASTASTSMDCTYSLVHAPLESTP